MPPGNTPSHTQTLNTNNLPNQQVVVIALEAAIKLSWHISYLSNGGMIAYTNPRVQAKNAELRILFRPDALHILSSSTGSEMFDWGRNKKFIKSFIEAFNQVKTVSAEETLAARYEQLVPSLVPPEADMLQYATVPGADDTAGILDVFKPKKDYFITPILLDLNVIIFIIMGFSGINILEPDGQSILAWGANFKPLTLGGQWWRLLTACFLHFGIFHLLMNMYALVFIGLLLEPYLGKLRFLSAYLLTGIAASIISLWWHDLTISAGASGAIFGMYGVFLALLTTSLIDKRQRKIQLSSIAIFVGYNLLSGLKPGVDNAAHIGGLLTGLIIGYATVPSLRSPQSKALKAITVALLSLLILIASFALYRHLPNDFAAFETRMKEFSAREQEALSIIDLPKGTSDSAYIYKLRHTGITNWQRNIAINNEIAHLDLPAHMLSRNQKLKQYSTLRLKSYELILKNMEEHTSSYNPEIDSYRKQIEAIIQELAAGK